MTFTVHTIIIVHHNGTKFIAERGGQNEKNCQRVSDACDPLPPIDHKTKITLVCGLSARLFCRHSVYYYIDSLRIRMFLN